VNWHFDVGNVLQQVNTRQPLVFCKESMLLLEGVYACHPERLDPAITQGLWTDKNNPTMQRLTIFHWFVLAVNQVGFKVLYLDRARGGNKTVLDVMNPIHPAESCPFAGYSDFHLIIQNMDGIASSVYQIKIDDKCRKKLLRLGWVCHLPQNYLKHSTADSWSARHMVVQHLCPPRECDNRAYKSCQVLRHPLPSTPDGFRHAFRSRRLVPIKARLRLESNAGHIQQFVIESRTRSSIPYWRGAEGRWLLSQGCCMMAVVNGPYHHRPDSRPGNGVRGCQRRISAGKSASCRSTSGCAGIPPQSASRKHGQTHADCWLLMCQFGRRESPYHEGMMGSQVSIKHCVWLLAACGWSASEADCRWRSASPLRLARIVQTPIDRSPHQ
jgi:hypothetical protein